jgi:hypothetical protein
MYQYEPRPIYQYSSVRYILDVHKYCTVFVKFTHLNPPVNPTPKYPRQPTLTINNRSTPTTSTNDNERLSTTKINNWLWTTVDSRYRLSTTDADSQEPTITNDRQSSHIILTNIHTLHTYLKFGESLYVCLFFIYHISVRCCFLENFTEYVCRLKPTPKNL